MQKISILFLCLSMVLVFGSMTIVEGQESDTEMIVPMGTIEIGAPEEVEPTRSPVEFPHSQHFTSVYCKTCHHDWKGTEIIKGCAAADCHDVTVSPTKSEKNASSPVLAIKYYKTAYHKMCIGCHREIKIQNKKLEVISNPHLRPNGCVVPRIEILTYSPVRSVFNPRDALPLNLI